MRAALALAGLLLLAGCGGSKTVTVTQTVTQTRTTTVPATTTTGSTAGPCLASALSGTFDVIPGSPAAGGISYRLRLTSQSDSPCFLTGLPVAQLLDKNGAKLPTVVSPAHPGTATAVRVELKPGDAAVAEARFSPDIPGGSEPTDAPCEPKAATLRVTIGDGTVDAPVDPPTPVCERGALAFSNFTAAH